MKKTPFYILPLVLLWLLSSGAFAQSKSSTSRIGSEADSVQRWLDQAAADYTARPLLAFDLVQKALLQSIEEGNTGGQARSYLLLGRINRLQEQYGLALDYADRAGKLYGAAGDAPGALQVDWLRARIYADRGETTEAIAAYEEILGTSKALNEETRVEIANELGELYLQAGKNDDAEEQYREVLQQEQKKSNKRGASAAYRNIGRAKEQAQEEQQALDFYQQSLDLAEEEDDAEEQIATTNQIADLYSKQGKLEEELNTRQRVLNLAASAPASKPETINKDRLKTAEVYMRLNEDSRATDLLTESALSAEAAGDLSTASDAYRRLTDAYSKNGKLQSAMEAFTSFVSLKDSSLRMREEQMLASLELTRNLNEQQQKIDLLQKDVELNQRRMELIEQRSQLQASDLSRQKLIIWGLLLLLLLGLLGAWFGWKSFRQKRIANQLLALRSLRSQMNPHFIFNALNSVNNYIAKNDERAANRYLADFSRLMRAVLENSKHDLVSLQSEVQIITLYLELEHARFKDKFDYTLEIDDSLDLAEVELPPMLIQPYLENAVWHGLRYLPDKGRMDISIGAQGDGSLRVLIVDTGIGRSKSAELKTTHQRESKSTGMANTQTRMEIINQMYGTRLHIAVSDAFPEREHPGTRVEVIIPTLSQKDIKRL